jgi:hypothetical protein
MQGCPSAGQSFLWPPCYRSVVESNAVLILTTSPDAFSGGPPE